MDVVIIGVDPHRRSVTIEARDTREVLRATYRTITAPAKPTAPAAATRHP